MCSDYKEIQRISKLVHEKVKNARAIRVVTDKGNDFTAEFSPELKWTVSDGDITPGHWKNLPDGEVFTSPKTLNGQVVIDGCLGDFFANEYALWKTRPSDRGQGRPGPRKACNAERGVAKELGLRLRDGREQQPGG
jgi:hypothetical protein